MKIIQDPLNLEALVDDDSVVMGTHCKVWYSTDVCDTAGAGKGHFCALSYHHD